MKFDKKCLRLAEEIRKRLGEPSELNRDTLHYIDSAFSNPSFDELGAILSDESDCERDSLLDLVFFPDEDFQIRLEDILESHDFQKQDEERIRDALFSGEPPHARIRLPNESNTLKLPMPSWLAERFIARLNVSENPDKRLVEAVGRHVREPDRMRFKVRLRNSRLVHTEHTVAFLCDFFEKMNPDTADLSACLDFALAFIGEIKENSDIYTELSDKKKRSLHHLQKLFGFEEKLEKNNMEILMLQGMRVPYADKETLLNQIAMIDVICLCVFGRIGAGDAHEVSSEMLVRPPLSQ